MGGAGYIGSHTVKHLLDNGYRVIVADNLVYGHLEAIDKRAAFIHADLLNSARPAKILSEQCCRHNKSFKCDACEQC